MERPPPRSLSTRLKHAALFVAMVWALAASFVAFDLLSLSATDAMLANPDALGDLWLSQATQQSTTCEVRPGEAAGEEGPVAASEARANAWMLGVHFGSDVQSRQWNAGSGKDARSNGEIERLAGVLAVNVPSPFSARQVANAHEEFVSHVEADATGTAHRLAVRYSKEACQLYKLGAFWGYAMWIRVALPGKRTAMAIPINYYGRQAGIPDHLTRAMITPASAAASRADRAAEAIALTQAVTTHLSGAPPLAATSEERDR
jgi:hypothetical protein